MNDMPKNAQMSDIEDFNEFIALIQKLNKDQKESILAMLRGAVLIADVKLPEVQNDYLSA